MYICVLCMSGARGGQKRTSSSQELELQKAASMCVFWEAHLDLLQEPQVLLATEPSC